MDRHRASDRTGRTTDSPREPVRLPPHLGLSHASAPPVWPGRVRLPAAVRVVCRAVTSGAGADADIARSGSVRIRLLVQRVARLFRFRFRVSMMVAHRTLALYSRN